MANPETPWIPRVRQNAIPGFHNQLLGVIGVSYTPQRIFRIAHWKPVGNRYNVPIEVYKKVHKGYIKTGGWKIHVSATPDKARQVAAAVLPILSRVEVWHKYVGNIVDLERMVGPQAGKFITIYANPDETDADDGWEKLVPALTNALHTNNLVQLPKITDHREVFVTPNGEKLADGISMRKVRDFTERD